MDNVIALPVPQESSVLAPASGAPRPLTVRRFQSVDEGSYAPVIRLKPRPRIPDDDAHVHAGQEHGVHVAPDSDGAPQERLRTAEEAARITGIVRAVTQACLEVLGGTRPIQQLSRWLDPKSYERLLIRSSLVRELEATRGRKAAEPARLHRRACIRSSRVCRLSASTYEASLVVAEAARVRAVAVRLELLRGQWKVTALEIG